MTKGQGYLPPGVAEFIGLNSCTAVIYQDCAIRVCKVISRVSVEHTT
jgi:hypothetical protein